MSLARRLIGRQSETRDIGSLGFDQWLDYFNFNGLDYPFFTMPGDPQHEVNQDFVGYVAGLYKANGIVFALMAVRMLLFAEARFQFQQMVKGRPGDLFGTPELACLETPWPGGTTGDMLSRAIQDVDLAGNWFARREGDSIVRMRPDWVTIVAGSVTGHIEDARPIGYAYKPGGPQSDHDELLLLPEQVAHFAPIPDPLYRFRGMSWLTPVIREVMADGAATSHKLKYWENSASPNLVVTVDASVKQDAFDKWVTKFNMGHEGVRNHFKTLFLGGGADAKVVGSNMEQAALKEIQGAGETRIAAAAGVPPILAGFSEGLAAGTYSNYGQARRRFADGTMRPLWRNFAGSIATLLRVPKASRLWYDDRDIAFLRDDAKDVADIQAVEASTLHAMISAGFEPDSAVAFIQSGDFSVLVHTGMYSVQLQPAGTVTQGKGALVQGVPTPAVSEAASALLVAAQMIRAAAEPRTDKAGRALLALLPGQQE